MENSDHNKKQTVSEKSLKEWKLPPSSASDFVSGRRGCFSFLPDLTVNTVEKSIPLSKGFSTFPLFSKHNTRLYQLLYGFVHVGMIQVALKPTKLGSNASATVCLRDERMNSYRNSILGKVESSLSDGPIYFSYFPNHCVALSDSHVCFTIDVKIRGKERVTLMYKFHYEVMKWPGLYDVSRYGVDERGETTMYITKIAENNRVVSRKIRWDRIGASEEEVGYENEEASSAPVGGTNVDWKETAEAHVLKVDVPGLEIEQVKVKVEDGRVLVISGDRGEEEEDKGKWHCVERRSGKFLRRMRLPENANMDQLTAAMKSGVLTVTIPKEEVVQNSKVKIISISG